MHIPSWLMLVTSWIQTLTCIGVFGLALFKPVRNIYIKIYNRFVKEPDERNKVSIEKIISKQKEQEDQLDEITRHVKDRKESADAVDVAILHHLIFSSARGYLRRGQITLHELEDLGDLMVVYENLGGNGTAKEAYEKCKKLLKELDNE